MIWLEYFAYFVLIFTGFQFLNVILNTIFPSFLKEVKKEYNLPLISILIPARNEEINMGNILKDLIEQEYSNIEIIVFNDNSEDNTEQIVSDFANRDSRIRLVNSVELPTGWLGKTYACSELAKQSTGKFLLFLDADVRVRGTIINRAVYFALSKKISLLSIFPMQTMLTFGEKITVPIMNFILLSLLPLIFVRKSFFKSHSAANGQFMLFDSEIYKQFKPHEYAKNQKVEDIAIARYLKRNKKRISLHLGDLDIRCRMYSSFDEAVVGFSKNIDAFFGNSYFLAGIFWLVNTFGFAFIYFAFGLDMMLLYLIAIAIMKICVALLSKQCVLDGLKFAILQQFSFLVILIKSIIYKINKSYQWKGRNI